MIKYNSTSFKFILFPLSVLLLIIPDIIYYLKEDILTIFLSLISKLFLYLFIYLIISSLIKSHFWTYLFVGLFYLLSSSIEIVNVIILGNYTTMDNIKALYYTSFSEIGEFINGFYIYMLLPIFVLILYFFILQKYKKYKFQTIRFSILIATTFLMISFGTAYLKVYNSNAYYSGNSLVKITLKKYFLKEHPLSLYYRIYEFGITLNRLNKFRKQKDSFKFGIIEKEKFVRPDLVILVIGERIRYSNWGINGYKRPTSKNLDNVSNLISFEKHYSNGNSTSASIPLLITKATPQKPELAYSEKTIVSLFKEAGYETFWISNQNIFDYIDNKGEVENLFELYNESKTDLDILPVFNKVLNKNTVKKRLIVINMVGGHGKIPEQFNLYKPNSSKKKHSVSVENLPIIINDYDNMIMFQDFVLGKIINALERENKSCFFVFTADHGCNLFDGNKALFGYGSQNPTEKETHIPLFIWGSSKYIKENSQKFDNLIKNKKQLTTNTNLFSTIADLSNIQYKNFNRSESIADSTYLVSSFRYVYVNGEALKFNSK